MDFYKKVIFFEAVGHFFGCDGHGSGIRLQKKEERVH